MTEVTRMRWLVFQLFFLFSCINYILAKVESFKKDAIRLGVSGSRGLWVSGVSGSPGSRSRGLEAVSRQMILAFPFRMTDCIILLSPV